MILFICCFVAQLGWAQTEKVSSALKEKAENAGMEIVNKETNPMDPVSVGATLVWSEDKTQIAIVLKASIAFNWHIYAYVSDTQPYISTKLKLDLPEGISPIGEWKLPYSEPYDDGVYVYYGEPVFIQYCAINSAVKNSKISCGLYYQTCDRYKCFPPETKTKELEI
ncbi:protein-disulfide reductase DsbD domain-containing protein [uncultured Polaribacter sp.]|uniref:protein-disulfide reductase DsbD domain-containing protein n=1 Tax=uncultured Polaribacter sp. TaxID=174711 RepID=UPI0026054E99|nr:protein-disulfide reductase DsbD domain-containing protein [uncultured Polaribacter sp.]